MIEIEEEIRKKNIIYQLGRKLNPVGGPEKKSLRCEVGGTGVRGSRKKSSRRLMVMIPREGRVKR